jgi:hypothetical protein
MREDRRGDGSVALYGGDGDGDMVLIEPAVEKFTILNGDLRCACGARLRPWVRATPAGAPSSAACMSKGAASARCPTWK